MNRQRKVLITTTYNEMGIIIDTKAEEVPQPNLQPTCNQLATDFISRQDAIDALWKKRQALNDFMDKCLQDDLLVLRQQTKIERNRIEEDINIIEELPSAQPERWIPVSERPPEEMGSYMTTIDYGEYGLATGQRYYHGALGWEDECVIAWMSLPEPYKGEKGGLY